MAEERRAVSVVKGFRQAALFPREVVRRLTRGRYQRPMARLDKEERLRKSGQPRNNAE